MKQYIGPEPKKPIYVKTVHRVGCRFTAHRSAIVMIKHWRTLPTVYFQIGGRVICHLCR